KDMGHKSLSPVSRKRKRRNGSVQRGPTPLGIGSHSWSGGGYPVLWRHVCNVPGEGLARYKRAATPPHRINPSRYKEKVMRQTVVAAVILLAPQLASAQEPATVLKHDGWVAAVAFATDGKTLASAGADNVVRLWQAGTWKPQGVLKGHTDCVCA